MRRYEHIFLMFLLLPTLSFSALWFWTELSHSQASHLVEQTLVKKIPASNALMDVLTDYPNPSMEILAGPHLFYSSLLAIGAAKRTDISESTRLQWLKQAKDHLPSALLREPANSNAWVHLAYTTWLLEGPGTNVMDALRMSIYTSPENRQVLLWRLNLACQNQEFWDPGFRNLLPHQIVMAWHLDQKSLAEMTGEFHLTDLVKESLANDPEELARFEKMKMKS
jgi:hypothetical protein